MTTDITAIEHFLQQVLTVVSPHATAGLILAACLVALSRLPLLSIAAMVSGGACLAVIVSGGDGGAEVGMALLVAAGVSGGVLLLSGGVLWRRPTLGALRRRTAMPSTSYPIPSTLSPLPAQNFGFRLAALAVIVFWGAIWDWAADVFALIFQLGWIMPLVALGGLAVMAAMLRLLRGLRGLFAR